MLTALVETTRGLEPDSGLRENLHHGAIAVVDPESRVLWSAGDPTFLCFTRSTLKPIQALPFLLDGGLQRFGFGSRQLALLCASHSGEDQQVELVRQMLATIGSTEDDLQCGVHVPSHFAARGTDVPPGVRWTCLHNNCSGKHCGFLAWCRLHDLSTEAYLDVDHPLQRRIRQITAALAGVPAESLAAGIDGCSAPNYALPLDRLAHIYARLAQGYLDAEFGPEFGAIFGAMTDFPELVSGQERSDLAYARTGARDWIAKAGADGVQVFGSRSARLGIAVKIADGGARAAQVACIEALAQLGLFKARSTALLEPWRAPVIRNHRGTVTGRMRPVFSLTGGVSA